MFEKIQDKFIEKITGSSIESINTSDIEVSENEKGSYMRSKYFMKITKLAVLFSIFLGSFFSHMFLSAFPNLLYNWKVGFNDSFLVVIGFILVILILIYRIMSWKDDIEEYKENNKEEFADKISISVDKKTALKYGKMKDKLYEIFGKTFSKTLIIFVFIIGLYRSITPKTTVLFSIVLVYLVYSVWKGIKNLKKIKRKREKTIQELKNSEN